MRWIVVLLVVGLFNTGLWAQDKSFVGDKVPGLVAGYSLEKLQSAYKGPVLLVRRSSDDARLDIGFKNRGLDEEALSTFVSQDTAFVSLLYDQSGNEYNAGLAEKEHQPWVVDGPNKNRLLGVEGTQGLGLPKAYTAISGAKALTIFLVARWDGTAADQNIHLLNAGRYVPEAGLWPLGIFLQETVHDMRAGRPVAQLTLADSSQVSLSADGTVGRSNTYEIHELVFDKDGAAAFYNSGRLVDQDTLNGQELLLAAPFKEGLFWGTNGNYRSGFTGGLGPLLIFDRALPENERAIVRQALAEQYQVTLPANKPPSGDEFTIVYIPDTQRYAGDTLGVQAQTMQAAMNWIRDHQSSWNIELVLQGGDVVDAGYKEDMWRRADKWFQTLDTTGIPYAVVPGNHDYQGDLNNRDSENYNTYFPSSRFSDTNWWNGEFYEAGKSDNFYFTRSIKKEEYLVLGLEFQPRAKVVAWADSVLAAHPAKKAIVLTHDFMNEKGKMSSHLLVTNDATNGDRLHNQLMSRHDNIWLVLSGHHGNGASRRMDKATGAHYMFFDPMFLDWGNQGFIRLLTVSPGQGTIRTMTYSPALDRYRSDYKNLFTLDKKPQVGSVETTDGQQPIISQYVLAQNYPNPFNSSTQIKYTVPEAGRVEINVYDMLGRKVAQLVNGYREVGEHLVTFNANKLPSGIYIYRMETGSFRKTRDMVLVK